MGTGFFLVRKIYLGKTSNYKTKYIQQKEIKLVETVCYLFQREQTETNSILNNALSMTIK